MKESVVTVYNLRGEKIGEERLNPKIFAIPFNDALVHQVIVAQQASGRQVLAHTKDRGEVRGGGRKPWRQKGTGRARHGSIRSPLWAGGGVTFGPRKNRNFAKRINKKMRDSALKMVLSDKARNGKLIVIDVWDLGEPKTKKLNAALQTLPSKMSKATLVTELANKDVIVASRNLPYAVSLGIGSLNVVDLLRHEYLIIPKKLLTTIEQRLVS